VWSAKRTLQLPLGSFQRSQSPAKANDSLQTEGAEYIFSVGLEG
jgi:hypothetical protein